MRPKGINDLRILWAIRDIPAKILSIQLKSILYTMTLTIGNNHEEWFYHSHKDWANKIGCSHRSIPRFFQSLEDLGFIFINRPKYYGNQRASFSNEYKLNYELIIKMAEDNQ